MTWSEGAKLDQLIIDTAPAIRITLEGGMMQGVLVPNHRTVRPSEQQAQPHQLNAA